MGEKEAYKAGREEKQSIFVFGCVVVVFIGMKILESGW